MTYTYISLYVILRARRCSVRSRVGPEGYATRATKSEPPIEISNR